MRRFFFIIIVILSVGFHAGCRAKLDTSSSTSRRQTDVIGLELRKLDSLWRSSSERQTLKIEFYPAMTGLHIPEVLESLDCLQGSPEAAPELFMAAAQSHQGGAILPAGGGMGAVKSIEITTEKEETVQNVNATDSTYKSTIASKEDCESSVVSEARQDNGTVATIAIVFAVAALIWLAIKTFLKR